MQFSYEYQGAVYTINVEKQADGTFLATIGDQQIYFQAIPQHDGGWLLQLPDGRARVQTASKGDARFIYVDGNTYTLEATDTRKQRRKSSSERGDLTAQMPGQVLDVLVVEGDTVTRGQTLVILEAMKMEIRVAAPSDGIIKRVLIAKKQVVERGQALVEIGSLD